MLVLGAGTVGANAAKVAAGFGANIGLLDTNLERLRYLDDVTPPNIDCLYSDRHTIREWRRRPRNWQCPDTWGSCTTSR